MKYIAMPFFALCVAGSVFADDHGENLIFAPRQDSAPMALTSIHLNNNGGVITAVGDMGAYGRVYTTYTLTRVAYKAPFLGRAGEQWRMVPSHRVQALVPTTVKERHSRCTSFSRSVMALRI